MTTLVWPMAMAIVGLLLGPWLGIVVDRAVEREAPALCHRCPRCRTEFGASSLIPMRSWFRRCPEDASHPQWRYPAIDLATAACFAVVGLRLPGSWMLVPYLVLFALFVTMSVIDLEHKLLLDILTFPTLGLGLFLVLFLSGLNDAQAAIGPALAGAGLYGVILLAAYLAYPPGLGFGDVKLAPSLGLAMGWVAVDVISAVRMVMYAIIVGFLIMGILGVMYGRLTGQGRKAEVPAGPFLVLGALTLIVVSHPEISSLGRP